RRVRDMTAPVLLACARPRPAARLPPSLPDVPHRRRLTPEQRLGCSVNVFMPITGGVKQRTPVVAYACRPPRPPGPTLQPGPRSPEAYPRRLAAATVLALAASRWGA